jgi:hypothetical protein
MEPHLRTVAHAPAESDVDGRARAKALAGAILASAMTPEI